MSDPKPVTESSEFINQSQTISRLNQLLEQAAKRVWLVSPYVRFDRLRNLQRSVTATRKRGVEVTLVVRAPDKSTSFGSDDVAALRELVAGGVRLQTVKDLHAKLYVSDRHALVTSLNLLDTSFANSIEIGHWVPAGDKAFGELRAYFNDEIRPYLRDATPDQLLTLQAEAKAAKGARKEVELAKPEPGQTRTQAKRSTNARQAAKGYCIACGDRIALDPDRPYCGDDYANADEGDVENHCHVCGKEGRTTLERPLCKPCYREWTAGDDAPF